MEGGVHLAALRFAGLEVGTVGGRGPACPTRGRYLALARLPRSWQGAARLAQIVAATALALELSVSAAMARDGSENFFKAHHERGGLR